MRAYTDDEVVSPIGIGAKHGFVPARHAKAGGLAYTRASGLCITPKPLRSEYIPDFDKHNL